MVRNPEIESIWSIVINTLDDCRKIVISVPIIILNIKEEDTFWMYTYNFIEFFRLFVAKDIKKRLKNSSPVLNVNFPIFFIFSFFIVEQINPISIM